MPSVATALRTLQTTATRVARLAGDPQTLATQEVERAFRDGTINRAQRDVLQRALSEGRPDVARVRATLGEYAPLFASADTNGNGVSDRSEQQAADRAYVRWIELASSPRSTRQEIDAARAAALKIRGMPVSGVGTLLRKLAALAGDAPPSRYSHFQTQAIRSGAADGHISVRDARAIVGNYHWTRHAEFTQLMGDRQMKFAPGARAIISRFLSGPLPESVPAGPA